MGKYALREVEINSKPLLLPDVKHVITSVFTYLQKQYYLESN